MSNIFDVQTESLLTIKRYWEFINQTLNLLGIDRSARRGFIRRYDPQISRMLNVKVEFIYDPFPLKLSLIIRTLAALVAHPAG